MTAQITTIVVITLIAVAIGLVVWAADKEHARYGAVLPIGVSVVTALIVWIITAAANLANQPTWVWVPWVASLVAAAVVSPVVSLWLSRKRAQQDVESLTSILKG